MKNYLQLNLSLLYWIFVAPFTRKFAADLRGTQVGTPYYGIYAPGTARPHMGTGAAWSDAGLRRITLHECRHTYASLLMAAGYTLKELMEFMGHADLQMVNRYVKLLPQPGEADVSERLTAYLRRATEAGR